MADAIYLVELSETKKSYRIKCKAQEVEFALKAELHKHCIEIPSEVELEWECYDKDFGIYYVITKNEVPEGGGTLKVSYKTSPPENKENIICNNVVEVTDTTEIRTDVLPQNSFGNPLPRNFTICENNFPSSLKIQLGKKCVLETYHRTALIDSIYDQVTRHGVFYPTSSEYKRVAEALLNKYPYLANLMEIGDAVAYWKDKVMSKYRNARRRSDAKIPTVINKKRAMAATKLKNKRLKELDSEDSKTEKKCAATNPKPDYSHLANYLPSAPKGEDNASAEFNRKTLLDLFKKSAIDKVKVKTLMDQTFHLRRRYIIGTQDCPQKSIAEILELFPFMTDPDNIFEEFTRLTQCSIVNSLNEGLSRISPYFQVNAKDMDDQPSIDAGMLNNFFTM